MKNYKISIEPAGQWFDSDGNRYQYLIAINRNDLPYWWSEFVHDIQPTLARWSANEWEDNELVQSAIKEIRNELFAQNKPVAMLEK